MGYSDKIILIDGDSIAYMAGIGETEQDVRNIVDMYMTKIKNQTWEGFYELFIEDEYKNIFRNHVALTKPYKGNRKGPKPPMLGFAKDYMEERWFAHMTHYYESEDHVAIRSNMLGACNVIIATIDKDLRQIEGTFYDYRKDETYMITRYQGEVNFWTQVLTGDATDNIPGLPGIGPKKAEKIMFGQDDVDILPSAVIDQYVLQGKTYGYFLEQCRLLRMLRSYDEVYTPHEGIRDYYEKKAKEG